MRYKYIYIYTFFFFLTHANSPTWRRKWQPTPVFLPGESQVRGSLAGCRLWGRTESATTEATQQQQQQLSYYKDHWSQTTKSNCS